MGVVKRCFYANPTASCEAVQQWGLYRSHASRKQCLEPTTLHTCVFVEQLAEYVNSINKIKQRKMKPVLFKSKITFKDNTIDEYCNIEYYAFFEKLSGLQRLTSDKGVLVSFCELSNKGYVVKKRYCFHKLAYLYEGYRVKKENGEYVPCCGSKSMFNMEYFESDAGCFVMTFFDKNGNRVEYYTKNLDDIDGLDDYYAEKYGCLSFYVRCYGSPVFLFDRVMQVNKCVHEKEFNQYNLLAELI